jgi:hypothetical protein
MDPVSAQRYSSKDARFTASGATILSRSHQVKKYLLEKIAAFDAANAS